MDNKSSSFLLLLFTPKFKTDNIKLVFLSLVFDIFFPKELGMTEKTPYICGPLTDLPPELIGEVKQFYVQIADLFAQMTMVRPFVPHEHFDPILHTCFIPFQVDEAERNQVCKNTNLLVIVAIQPSYGTGIKVEMANQSHVPALLLRPEGKKISRLLLGNPAIKFVLDFTDYSDALAKLKQWLDKEVNWHLLGRYLKRGASLQVSRKQTKI